jgi:hypothetical protein
MSPHLPVSSLHTDRFRNNGRKILKLIYDYVTRAYCDTSPAVLLSVKTQCNCKIQFKYHPALQQTTSEQTDVELLSKQHEAI